jgi:OmpA-OmpF porin, OOP family
VDFSAENCGVPPLGVCFRRNSAKKSLPKGVAKWIHSGSSALERLIRGRLKGNSMRKYLLAAVATVAIASPAYAMDDTWYAGFEAGAMLVEDAEFNYEDANVTIAPAFNFEHKTGYDVDVIGGYDAGLFRLEAEVAYKRAGLSDAFVAPLITTDPVDVDGHVSVLSSMANALLDFGDNNWSGYVGGGIGLARVKYRMDAPGSDLFFSDRDSALAWQLIAGIRHAITANTEVGLKYRYFRTGRLHFEGDEGFDGAGPFDLDTRYRSHSLLASLIFNFGRPVPPPPPPVVEAPPPPPPATQTCPDGTVILATEMCPAPPPPPPPPPAGERG